MIQTMTRDYQVVLVASAGEDPDESCGDTSVWPGLLASGCDIITVVRRRGLWKALRLVSRERRCLSRADEKESLFHVISHPGS